ncbi:hypothetical protein [Bacillus sp. GB_SG_008]|uniref:hypothetical protein n=1 Tax=Bacillus sp. GB_SG_008 TaxID=3454627 RepID=UPI003F85287D
MGKILCLQKQNQVQELEQQLHQKEKEHQNVITSLHENVLTVVSGHAENNRQHQALQNLIQHCCYLLLFIN